MVANPILHARTKHIEILFILSRKTQLGIIKVLYIYTKEQIVDLSTKLVNKIWHKKLIENVRSTHLYV